MGGRNSGGKPTKDIKLAEWLEPWEKQPQETDQAFAAFKEYRDLGLERTIPKAVQALGKKPNYLSTCEAWSQRWGWRLRVDAWDKHVDQKERTAALTEAAKKAKQKLGFAEAMWMTAMRGLSMWNEYFQEFNEKQKERKSNNDDLAVPPISPGEVQRLAEAGIKLALLLEGKPTEIGEQRHQVTVDDRRKEIQKIINDKRVRDAMRVVAEASEGYDGDSVH